MSPEQPDLLRHAEWDRALFWMVLLSALAHLGVVVVLVLVAPRFGFRPRALTAYTVELVSSDQLAGTNLVPGSKAGKVEAPPKVEPKPPPPPPPKVEEVKKPAPPEPKPEPKKEEPEPVEEKAVAVAAATPPPVQPTATPIVQAKAEAPAKPEPKPKPETKPAPVAAAPTAQVHKPIGPPTPTKAELAARERDQRIAKAVAQRAKQAATEQAGTGSGTGKTGSQPGGGPVSVGPGQGPGAGVVKGVEYLLYYNQMIARLKEAWAWAGAKRELEAIVSFRIAEDGEVTDVRITRSSGDPTYDASVLRAVRAVSPLAPPPEAYRKEFSEVEITFSPASMNL